MHGLLHPPGGERVRVRHQLPGPVVRAAGRALRGGDGRRRGQGRHGQAQGKQAQHGGRARRVKVGRSN